MSVTATGFITDDELKSLVAASLLRDEEKIDTTPWDVSVTFWNVGTYNQLVGYWMGKGYALADVQSWVMGRLFQQNLALYSVLVKQNVDDNRIASWEKELQYWRDLLKEQEQLVTGSGLAEAASDVELFEFHTIGH